MTDLVPNPDQPVFTTRPTVTGGSGVHSEGIVVAVNGHDLLGIYPQVDGEGEQVGWDVGYWDAHSGEWVECQDSGDITDQMAMFLALGEGTFTEGATPS